VPEQLLKSEKGKPHHALIEEAHWGITFDNYYTIINLYLSDKFLLKLLHNHLDSSGWSAGNFDYEYTSKNRVL